MLIAWTIDQLMHEVGTVVASFVAVVCIAYLSRRAARLLRTREDELLDQGVATGLTRKRAEIVRNRRRFSVLDLLAIVTLIAALTGLWRGLTAEEDRGIPKFKMERAIESAPE
jgi:hypothetical protein